MIDHRRECPRIPARCLPRAAFNGVKKYGRFVRRRRRWHRVARLFVGGGEACGRQQLICASAVSIAVSRRLRRFGGDLFSTDGASDFAGRRHPSSKGRARVARAFHCVVYGERCGTANDIGRFFVDAEREARWSNLVMMASVAVIIRRRTSMDMGCRRGCSRERRRRVGTRPLECLRNRGGLARVCRCFSCGPSAVVSFSEARAVRLSTK